jgi:hypothetical protein
MESEFRCARQREQEMAAGFKKDEALLCDSEDWFDEMLLAGKPHNKASSFKTRQSPTQRSWSFSEDSER